MHLLHHLGLAAIDDRDNQRLFAREVLIQGANADAGQSRDLVGAGSLAPARLPF
jgi:hypothetical protein